MCSDEIRPNGSLSAISIVWSLPPISVCAARCERLGDCGARDRHSVGIVLVSFVRKMEVEVPGRQTKGPARNSPLIRDISRANPRWGAPRIHGELLKLGIDVGQTPSPNTWQGAEGRHPKVGSLSCTTMPMESHRSICCRPNDLIPVVIRLVDPTARPNANGVTAHPTREWIARQLTEACGWDPVPRYILRDRDRAYGDLFKRRLRAMGIRDRPTAPRSP
jgi:hypothetical protein